MNCYSFSHHSQHLINLMPHINLENKGINFTCTDLKDADKTNLQILQIYKFSVNKKINTQIVINKGNNFIMKTQRNKLKYKI